MKICMILQANFPPDIRIEKEARALIAAGHELHLVCRNKTGLPVEDKFEGIHIHRLRSQHSNSRWNNLLTIPLFFNPVWKARVNEVVKKYKIDIIHVHDLPLAALGVRVAQKNKLPLIYDMHENYPEAMRVWYKGTLASFTMQNPAFVEMLDRYCEKKATKIIVVVEEQKENLIRKGVPAEKIHVISNTADVEKLEALPLDQGILDQFKDENAIMFVGGFVRDRALEVPIRAMKILKDKIPRTKLVLVGGGDKGYTAELKALVRDNHLEEYVEFIDWVPFEKVASYMKAAKIGIVPQARNDYQNTTISHKIFQYMTFGLPIIVADAIPHARVVREGNCGAVFTTGSENDFAEAVLRLMKEPGQFGQNGAQLVRKKYNWQNTARELQKLYSKFE